VFLHHIQAGPASKSFGLQVAKLAGIPAAVIDSAKAQLAILEGTPAPVLSSNNILDAAVDDGAVAEPKGRRNKQVQRDIFSSAGKLDAYIAAINPDKLTPLDALKLIYKLKEELELTA
jgi:DNA mismatch repair protein MutS